jgi:hypothetical protein
MPLGNIRLRVVTPEEAYWAERWMKFEGREIRELFPVFRRMSKREFMAFLYSRHPRQALVWAGEPEMRDIIAYQREKRFYHEWRDALCRLLKL